MSLTNKEKEGYVVCVVIACCHSGLTTLVSDPADFWLGVIAFFLFGFIHLVFCEPLYNSAYKKQDVSYVVCVVIACCHSGQTTLVSDPVDFWLGVNAFFLYGFIHLVFCLALHNSAYKKGRRDDGNRKQVFF